jgi:DNA-binding NtrC family response regulator
MKKILIIAKDEIIRETLKLACNKMGIESIAANHADALSEFFTQEPVAVIVCDYEESDKEFKGVETFRDIRNSATDEKVICVGFSKLEYADYIQMPFDLEKLKRLLNP